jgi:hypothetical protein
MHDLLTAVLLLVLNYKSHSEELDLTPIPHYQNILHNSINQPETRTYPATTTDQPSSEPTTEKVTAHNSASDKLVKQVAKVAAENSPVLTDCDANPDLCHDVTSNSDPLPTHTPKPPKPPEPTTQPTPRPPKPEPTVIPLPTIVPTPEKPIIVEPRPTSLCNPEMPPGKEYPMVCKY